MLGMLVTYWDYNYSIKTTSLEDLDPFLGALLEDFDDLLQVCPIKGLQWMQ